MKIPWIEKCPWLASVATRYFVNGLARQPEQKETSFMKILPAMHRGRLAGLLLAVIPPKGLVIFFREEVLLPHLSKPFVGMCWIRWDPLCQSPKLELIGKRDSSRWTIRIFFL